MNKLHLLMLIVAPLIGLGQVFDALSNPKIYVDIEHPPGLGLKIDKVIFNPATGNCSDQIIDGLITDFISNDIEVIDRANLQTILSEQNFNLSAYVDPNTAISIGKMIGPSAMITIKVLKCSTDVKNNLYVDEKRYNSKTKEKYIARAYIARTTAYLKASIQTTDLTTGRIFASRVLEYAPSKENKSYTGIPEAPDKFDVQELAFKKFVKDVHKMFFFWTESTDLHFMDSKKGGLKDAFKALKEGKVEKALELSKRNLEFCKNNADIKDKTLAHAYYNLGMMFFIKTDYGSALKLFKESQKVRKSQITKDAINECKRAQQLSEEMKRVDDKANLEIEKINTATDEAKKEKVKNTINNDDIISMTKQQLPTALIKQKIKTSPCHFDTSTDELIKLSNAGVDEDVLILMMEKNN